MAGGDRAGGPRRGGDRERRAAPAVGGKAVVRGLGARPPARCGSGGPCQPAPRRDRPASVRSRASAAGARGRDGHDRPRRSGVRRPARWRTDGARRGVSGDDRVRDDDLGDRPVAGAARHPGLVGVPGRTRSGGRRAALPGASLRAFSQPVPGQRGRPVAPSAALRAGGAEGHRLSQSDGHRRQRLRPLPERPAAHARVSPAASGVAPNRPEPAAAPAARARHDLVVHSPLRQRLS